MNHRAFIILQSAGNTFVSPVSDVETKLLIKQLVEFTSNSGTFQIIAIIFKFELQILLF